MANVGHSRKLNIIAAGLLQFVLTCCCWLCERQVQLIISCTSEHGPDPGQPLHVINWCFQSSA
jgi:hypothetical protein